MRRDENFFYEVDQLVFVSTAQMLENYYYGGFVQL
jgi:hypothetical protein